MVSAATSDSMTGNAGNDFFVFGDNWGNDTIQDFEDGFDLIDLSSHTTMTDINDLTISQNGADTVIDDGNGNSITLTGIDQSLLDSDDFLF